MGFPRTAATSFSLTPPAFSWPTTSQPRSSTTQPVAPSFQLGQNSWQDLLNGRVLLARKNGKTERGKEEEDEQSKKTGPVIGFLPFQTKRVSAESGKILLEGILTGFKINFSNYQFRDFAADSISMEEMLPLVDCTELSTECAKKLGTLGNVNKVVWGELERKNGFVYYTIEVIDILTGEVEFHYSSKLVAKNLDSKLPSLASSIMGEYKKAKSAAIVTDLDEPEEETPSPSASTPNVEPSLVLIPTVAKPVVIPFEEVVEPLPEGPSLGWPITFMSVGAAALGAAAGVGIVVNSKEKDFCPNCADPVPMSQEVLDGRFSEGKTLALADNILWSVGGAALVTGGILLILELTGDTSSENPVNAAVDSNSGNTSLFWEF
ncbi:MAG: hypothetical protein Q7S68_04650 [Deltaproteobacteria bacterium]|nr:hypothetical protein [Deltaproteobacteria bacterium]